MHQIGVVGLSYRHAGVDQVARFAVPRTEVPARLPALRTLLKAAEILYVGTCNRVEVVRSEEHTSELQSQSNLVCRLLLEKKNKQNQISVNTYAVTYTINRYNSVLGTLSHYQGDTTCPRSATNVPGYVLFTTDQLPSDIV